MLYLLSINNILNYVTQEKVKKLRKKDIKDKMSKYTPDKFNDTLVYKKKH